MLEPEQHTETARKPSKLTSGYVLYALLAVMPLLLAWAVWRWQQPAAVAFAATPVKVAVATVSNRPLVSYVQAIGDLEAVQEVSVPAEIGGRVVELPIESGQRVSRGQILVRLNDAPQRGQLLRLQGQLDNTRTRLERMKQLIGANAISLGALHNDIQPNRLKQFNQQNSATFQAIPAPGVSLGEAVAFLAAQGEQLPASFNHDWQSDSRQFIHEGNALLLTFVLALVAIYMVLAAQYESLRDPLIILITVPLSICGALLALALGWATLNIYTQISLVPLLFASGAGASSRFGLGIVIVVGMIVGTLFTLFVLPSVYTVISKRRTQYLQERACSRAV